MTKLPSLIQNIIAVMVILLLFGNFLSVFAQTCDNSNTPPLTGRPVWAQNSLVSVNLNADQFSNEDLLCIQSVFDTYNLQSGATQGNFSGVYFSVSRSATAIATIDTTNNIATALPTTYGSNFTNRYQINRPPQLIDQSNDFGLTAIGGNGSNTTTAVTEVNSQITSCSALQITIAHEIAHTFGLDHCDVDVNGNDICAPNDSVMALPTCPESGCPPSEFNSPSAGTTGPTNCDTQRIREAGSYNQNTVDQPNPSGNGDGGNEGCPLPCGDCVNGCNDPDPEPNCGWQTIPGSCWTVSTEWTDPYTGITYGGETIECDPDQEVYVCE